MDDHEPITSVYWIYYKYVILKILCMYVSAYMYVCVAMDEFYNKSKLDEHFHVIAYWYL